MIKRLKELRKKATPWPWRKDKQEGLYTIRFGNDKAIAIVPIYGRGRGHQKFIDESGANAALIVETINNMDKLIAVCESAKPFAEFYEETKIKMMQVEPNKFLDYGTLAKSIAALEEE